MSECSHNCESCNEDCNSKKENTTQYEQLNKHSSVKRVIGVLSGKGGVGKSMVTCMLSVLFNRQGLQTAVLDADITGPSVPKSFGIKERAKGCGEGIIPAKTSTGIDIISTNMFLKNETEPTVWRGPVISGTVKQFWTDVIWQNEDYMFVDMPPGTGDVALTVFQSIPVDGIVIVTTPQDLVTMIVEKAVKMADMMNIPILGIVENNSYFMCDECGKKHYIFGESKVDEIAQNYGFPVLGKIPVETNLARCVDEGNIEGFIGDWLDNGVEIILEKTK